MRHKRIAMIMLTAVAALTLCAALALYAGGAVGAGGLCFALLSAELAAAALYPVTLGANRRRAERTGEFMRRVSGLADVINLPIGAFEIETSRGRVFLSRELYRIHPEFEDYGQAVPLRVWDEFLRDIGAPAGAIGAGITTEGLSREMFLSNPMNGGPGKWFTISVIPRESGALGALVDVTEEMLQRHKLEYERNFDALTGLLSRAAFLDRARALLPVMATRANVFMFADLDNLKQMNDTYGHDFGDTYIRAFADNLAGLKAQGGVVGRSAGDEFVAFLVGFESKQAAKQAVADFFDRMAAASITAPDGAPVSLPFSAGLAYAPDDARDIEDLMRFADYAMYSVKRSGKNGFAEFDKAAFLKSAVGEKENDLLDMLIEERRVKFAYQPIANARTGAVFAHEMFMRPMLRELKNPAEALKIARSQNKLYQLEKMSYSMIFDWTSKNLDKLGDSKIFVNSAPNHSLTKEDLQALDEAYANIFPRLVLQMNEADATGAGAEEKRRLIRRLGGAVGVDDFGVGHSGGIAALEANPEFIKIDMSLVRGVDSDQEKWKLVQNIVAYARKRNIEAIAEGVETYGELEAVIRAGAHYVQGYYLARPDFDLRGELEPEIREQIKALAARNGRFV